MKTIDKIILYIFSFIMLILSLIGLCVGIGFVKPSNISDGLNYIITHNGFKTTFLGIWIVSILLSLKALFIHGPKSTTGSGHGVLLENQNGKLMISKETIEDIVNSVANGYEGSKESDVNVVLAPNNTIDIYLTLSVDSNCNIKDLSSSLQSKIINKVKQVTDIDINEVNIKIKNITPQTNDQDQNN